MTRREVFGPDSPGFDSELEDAAMARGAARHRAKLIEKRHDLANKATVAKLQADEMFLEIKKLDKEIEELGHE